MTTEKKPRRKRRVWPWIVFPLLILLIGGGVVAYQFYTQAMDVRDKLTAAKKQVNVAVDFVKDGNAEGAQSAAAEILKLTTSADEIVTSPLWDIATKVPVVGVNVTAVQETTKATHILVRDAMPPALSLLATVDVKNLQLAGGGVNLQPFRDAQATVPVLATAFNEAQTHVDKIDRDAILPFVDENIGQLVDIVDDATPAMGMLEKYLPTALSVLGGDGPRDYAILFQNNAEIRSTGGNPGTAAILHVDNGKIEMREDWDVAQFIAAGLSGNGENLLDPASEADLFESDTAGFSQNFTRYPDFSDSAHAVMATWQRSTGTELNGVFSIDPVMLSYMLQVAGAVTVPGEDEQITADNAVKLLLSDTYERFGSDGLAADVYFAKAASAIFDKISDGGWDPLAMIEQFQKGIAEQRFYLWFPDAATQTMASELGVAGQITVDNSVTTQTGLFLNDASYSKLDYWLSTTMAVTCDATARTMTTAVTMKNSLPDSIQSSYTLGGRNMKLGFPRQTMLLDVIGLAVPGGNLTAVDPGTGDISNWDRSATYNGREGKSVSVALAQGETRTVSMTSSIPADATAPLTVRYTPTTSLTPVTIADSCLTMFPGTEVPVSK